MATAALFTDNGRSPERIHMKICGLQKTTLLDFPGRVAATVFTGGCNFRCPFCHNSELLGDDAAAAYTEEQVLEFLSRRTGILEGVAITGGEPTLQPDLEDFIQKVRALGYLIKLDTNGYRPGVLKRLVEQGLVDYVAMDIKTSPERYEIVAGVPGLILTPILESVEFLKSGVVDYEFRTTVVKELHSAEDFQKIGSWISGCPRYYLQNFTDSGQVLCPIYSGCTIEELTEFAKIAAPFVGKAEIRGVDY